MTWEQLFPKHILDRGFDYYHRGHVEDLYVREDVIEAAVHGSEKYDVHINKVEKLLI
ncbi:hypothetical protein SAMN05421736_10184 [Evansella caseinilytica]|uniref:Uncharacterized protein n=1 Tax=Evansella caseinilytica TaxID=1503961 RepID=A0A1H3G845_9BACI|nr:hypothetical protein [Evansella caseinilytica]SDX98818.1 hypothetical protein SAMN05421736_10184 [Evansella caseinilytica]